MKDLKDDYIATSLSSEELEKLAESDPDGNWWRDYALIIDAIKDEDVDRLRRFSEIVPGFPDGCDRYCSVGRYWITNAIDYERRKVVEWMLQQEVAIDFRDAEGFTVLHATIGSNWSERHQVLRLLLDAGADPDQYGINGFTAVHMAVSQNDIEALDVLLEFGADFSKRTEIDLYETPFELAADRDWVNEATRCWFREHGIEA